MLKQIINHNQLPILVEETSDNKKREITDKKIRKLEGKSGVRGVRKCEEDILKE